MDQSSPIDPPTSVSEGEVALHGTELTAAFTVADLERSLSWYQEMLGFTVARRFEREGKLTAVSLRAGDVRILLGQDDGAKGLDRVKGLGFSLQITTAQSIDAIADRVKSKGGTLTTEPVDTPWGVRMFRVQDPDGFRWTISAG